MDDRPVDTDEVVKIYEETLAAREPGWDYRGHRSLHFGLYDEDHDDPGSAAINTMRVLSAAAKIAPSDRVLNIGCGAGEDSVWNAKARGASVIGVDIGERQLAAAQENAREHDVSDRTAFRVDDFHELATVDDDSVDVVWALEALCHSPQPQQVLEQVQRVLVDDGRVALADLYVKRQPSKPERTRLRKANDGLGVRVGSVPALRSALTATGFTDIEFRDRTAGVKPSLARRSQFADVAGPVSKALSAVGLGSETRDDVIAGNDQLHELVLSGAVGYFIVTARQDTTPA
ncbi:MAG: methyltransferase domain protein [halophilic archaeon J07HX5]|nr:MAG: methyltransferase domain protein [halophilic archaeon J07HX5]